MAALHGLHGLSLGLDAPTVEPWTVAPQQEVSTGVSKLHVRKYIFCFLIFQTSIMAVEYGSGVIIGADSRTTSG